MDSSGLRALFEDLVRERKREVQALGCELDVADVMAAFDDWWGRTGGLR